MSSASSSAGAWYTRLEPASPPDLPRRPDDPRLGERVEFWQDSPPRLWPGRPVLLGFPQDEGVRRNKGRLGAADGPAAIRHWLSFLTLWDAPHGRDLAALDLLDVGDVRIVGDLEESQQALAEVIAALLTAGCVPIVLGGGHETAYGHYLGYVGAGRSAAILNLDAHLDVRPTHSGLGHSGSPFRQAREHPTHPLPGDRYVCLGAQPFAVSREHQKYVEDSGGVIRWCPDVRGQLEPAFRQECDRLAVAGCPLYVTLDADVVRQADMPGVSAPNPLGLSGIEVASCVAAAGASPAVSSFDLVEINPSFDRDGQSARWAALVVWHFLAGLSRRPT